MLATATWPGRISRCPPLSPSPRSLQPGRNSRCLASSLLILSFLSLQAGRSETQAMAWRQALWILELLVTTLS